MFLPAVLFLAGCVEEEGTLTLLPDGSGRIDLDVRFGPLLSGNIREEAGKGRELLEASRARLAGNWEGLAFWTDEVAEDVGDRVRYRGSAWFRDFNAVRFSGEPCRWVKQEEGAGFAAELSFDPLPAPGEGQTRAEQAAELREWLKGFDAVLTLRLPGTVTQVSGPARAEGREVVYRLTEENLLAGAQLGEDERAERFHRFRVESGPALAEAEAEQEAFSRAWVAMESVGVPHARVAGPRPDSGPLPEPPPLETPLTRGELERFYPVPETPPDWRLERGPEDTRAETWSGSLRGSREERIPVLVRVPRSGRPCPVLVRQHTWHGTKEESQEASAVALERGVAVVTFDGPLVGERKREGRDPLGDDDGSRVDNHRWAVSDLRCLLRALPEIPLPEGVVLADRGAVVAGVSLGGPTAVTAFALEEDSAAAGATVVAGAGAYSAARDGEPAGAALEGAGDVRLRSTPEEWREAALLDPAMILPLVRPRPLAVVGGEEDGFAPGSGLRRLARAAEVWPEVFLRVHPEMGHFLTEEQGAEATAWVIGQALRLKEKR